MFVFQISLLIVTFLSLISRKLLLMQTTKEVNPHPHNASCVNMWSVFFFFFLCHLLMHMSQCLGRSSGVDHTTPLKCCTLCYSTVSRIHVNTTKLHNITCTLEILCCHRCDTTEFRVYAITVHLIYPMSCSRRA